MDWNGIPAFLGPSKLFFFNPFQSEDLHSVWFAVAISETFFFCGGHPWLIPHTCALPTHTLMQKHTQHPALNHSPKSFQCLSLEKLGFWFVVLPPHSTFGTICLFSTCLDCRESIFVSVPFWSSPGHCQNILQVNKKSGGEKKIFFVQGRDLIRP